MTTPHNDSPNEPTTDTPTTDTPATGNPTTPAAAPPLLPEQAMIVRRELEIAARDAAIEDGDATAAARLEGLAKTAILQAGGTGIDRHRLASELDYPGGAEADGHRPNWAIPTSDPARTWRSIPPSAPPPPARPPSG